MPSHLHSSQVERLKKQACANLEQTPDMPFDFACCGKLPWIESQKVDARPETGLGYQHCSTPRGPSADLGPVILGAAQTFSQGQSLSWRFCS